MKKEYSVVGLDIGFPKDFDITKTTFSGEGLVGLDIGFPKDFDITKTTFLREGLKCDRQELMMLSAMVDKKLKELRA